MDIGSYMHFEPIATNPEEIDLRYLQYQRARGRSDASSELSTFSLPFPFLPYSKRRRDLRSCKPLFPLHLDSILATPGVPIVYSKEAIKVVDQHRVVQDRTITKKRRVLFLGGLVLGIRLGLSWKDSRPVE